MFGKCLNRYGIALVAVCLATSFFAAYSQAQQANSVYEEKRRALNLNTVTIIGSQAKTSYTQMAQDMQNVLDDLEGNSLRVLPILGRGGGQNFLDILFLQGIDMGIVERDVIDNYKQKNPSLYGNINERLRYIVKLANSEMHFFVRHEIKKLEDLRGRKVSFYKPGSSSEQAIEKILGACEIEVERVYADTQLGAEKLRKGEIVAVGRISGAPHGALINFTSEDGHFLPLDEANLPPGCYERLMKIYLPAALKHQHYPNVLAAGETVPTVANATLLATYDFPEDTERYQSIAKFVKKLFDNIDKFHEEIRHPKWKEINIAAKVPGWTRLKAAEEWIKANATTALKPSSTEISNELKLAFERFLQEQLTINPSKPLTAAQKQALLDQFAEWWKAQNAARN